MSDRPARIVTAKPPRRRLQPSRSLTASSHAPASPASSAAAALSMSSAPAIAAFRALLAGWKLPAARGWQMLAGQPRPATTLTPDQITRVQHLLAIDAGIRWLQGDGVATWMVTGNGAAVTSGQSPVDFLTRAGTVGYAALARQVAVWAAV